MKKVRSIVSALILSTCLAGNSFAGDFGDTVMSNFFAAFWNMISFTSRVDDCEGRICTNCKPQAQGSGNCRPTP